MNTYSAPQDALWGDPESAVQTPVRPSVFTKSAWGAGESEEEAATEEEPERGSTLAPILEDPEEELHPSEEARRVRVVKDPSAPTKA